MRLGFAVLVLAAVLAVGWRAQAIEDSAPSEAPSEQTWQDELLRGFSWRAKAVGFFQLQEPEESPLNPYNALEISRYRTELDLRPDLDLQFKRLELGVKPRLAMYEEWWEDGFLDGESHGKTEPYVHEWIARLMVHEQLFVSYGRENLQWGPSSLISPSNPFIQDNGKNNPEIEVPGLDYARAVWNPSTSWSASFIANTDDGEADFLHRFEKGYAVKLDWTGNKKYVSLIPAWKDADDSFQVGYYGGWSVTDALLLYAEGAFQENERASVLTGGSYTFSFGPTVSVEYYHNGSGARSEPIQLVYAPFGPRSMDEVLVRENYVLVQYTQTRILNRFNVILRWIEDTDDTSNMTVGILEYELGNHTKLFAIGNYFSGNDETEFGSLLKYSAMVGAELNF